MAMFKEAQGAVETDQQPGEPQATALSSSAEQAIAQAVLTPAIATMIADGEISGFEVTQISNLCSFSPIYAQVGPQQLDAIIEQVINEVIVHGQSMAITRAGAALSPALRETALCFAIRIALADGYINDNERDSVVQTAEHLEIEPEIFEQVLDVVTMMQRPAVA